MTPAPLLLALALALALVKELLLLPALLLAALARARDGDDGSAAGSAGTGIARGDDGSGRSGDSGRSSGDCEPSGVCARSGGCEGCGDCAPRRGDCAPRCGDCGGEDVARGSASGCGGGSDSDRGGGCEYKFWSPGGTLERSFDGALMNTRSGDGGRSDCAAATAPALLALGVLGTTLKLLADALVTSAFVITPTIAEVLV